ncbi:ATP-binding protein [Patescibacteria group bacterium]
MKIRTKITLSSFLVLLISLAVIGLVMQIVSTQMLKEQIFEHLKTTIQSRAHHIRSFLEEQKVLVESLALVGKVEQLLLTDKKALDYNDKIKAVNERLEKTVVSLEGVDSIAVLDTSGVIIASTNKKLIGLNRSNNEAFLYGKKDTYAQGVNSALEETGEPIIFFSTPVIRDGEFLGVVVLRRTTESLNTILLNTAGLGETGEIYLMNRDDYMITPSRFFEDVILKQKVDTEASRNCFEKHPGGEDIEMFLYKDYRQLDVLGSHFFISSVDWCLIAKIDEKEALAPTIDIFWNYLIVALGVLITFFFLSWYLSRRISAPVERLRQGSEIIAGGDLDHKVGTEEKDEIGILSRAFDKMTLAIKKSRAEIDQKVEGQTKEIVGKQKDIEEQQMATLNVLEDVEEEKEKVSLEKEKTDTILHSIGDGVFVVDNDMKIAVFNKAAEQISGFTKEEVFGKKFNSVLKFLDEKDGSPGDEFVMNTLKTAKIQAMENHTVLVRKDGEHVPVADSSSPIKDKNGNVLGCVVVFRDVSQERKVEKMKSEFVSVASHQLRTPLTGIQWVAERLMKLKKLPKKELSYVNDIHISAQRLSRLVDDLLNVSRIEEGRIAVAPEKIDLINFIQDYFKECAPICAKKNIQITFSKHPKELEIFTDRNALQNVTQSVISNAIEYTPDNGKIDVTLEKKDSIFVFTVSDTGIGIPKEEQEDIFKKFSRGSNAQAVKTDGTGLGLYIVKQTVDLLGGKVWFESEENKGTTFFVELPLKSKAREGEVGFA